MTLYPLPSTMQASILLSMLEIFYKHYPELNHNQIKNLLYTIIGFSAAVHYINIDLDNDIDEELLEYGDIGEEDFVHSSAMNGLLWSPRAEKGIGRLGDTPNELAAAACMIYRGAEKMKDKIYDDTFCIETLQSMICEIKKAITNNN